MDDQIKKREEHKQELAKKRKKEQRKKVVAIQMAIITSILFLLILAGVAILTQTASEKNGDSVGSNIQEPDKNSGKENEEEKEEVKPTPTPETIIPVESTKITVSLAGDCTIGADKNANTSKNLNAYYQKYR